ncbi:hypothetical protein [Pigmentibacter ruber]|uniref:hypothetical protein n=1 Tax=Pigmentibacter ruber TaxID=2683196 RepID=UPI00131B9598|nr:hypothetical protein [Pigmentibacter ruber]
MFSYQAIPLITAANQIVWGILPLPAVGASTSGYSTWVIPSTDPDMLIDSINAFQKDPQFLIGYTLLVGLHLWVKQ